MSKSFNRNAAVLAGVLIIVLITAFSVPATRAASYRSKVAELQATLDSVTAELKSYQFSPERLLPLVRNALDSMDVTTAKTLMGDLKTYHPAAPQLDTARTLIASAEAHLEREAERAREEAERRRQAEIAVRERAEREERQRRERALAGMRKQVDDMRGVTFYEDRSPPRYLNTRSTLYFYIAHRPGTKPTLRMKLIYTGDGWVFFRRSYIKVGERVFDFSFSHFEVERDNGYGGVWEWVDVVAEGQYLALADALREAPGTVRIRFDGEQYQRERTMPAGDVAAVRRVLDAYEMLRANPNTR